MSGLAYAILTTCTGIAPMHAFTSVAGKAADAPQLSFMDPNQLASRFALHYTESFLMLSAT